MASGGHPPPILRRADGGTEVVPLGGSLLGAFDDPDVACTRAELHAGDTLVLMTDGGVLVDDMAAVVLHMRPV